MCSYQLRKIYIKHLGISCPTFKFYFCNFTMLVIVIFLYFFSLKSYFTLGKINVVQILKEKICSSSDSLLYSTRHVYFRRIIALKNVSTKIDETF